ncbi:MAG: ferrous iron transport protein A [Flavobacteriales bacterium]
MLLNELKVGEQAHVIRITDDVFRTKLLEMGIMPGTLVTLALKAPFKGPIAFSYENTMLSIREEDANNITVEKLMQHP